MALHQIFKSDVSFDPQVTYQDQLRCYLTTPAGFFFPSGMTFPLLLMATSAVSCAHNAWMVTFTAFEAINTTQ